MTFRAVGNLNPQKNSEVEQDFSWRTTKMLLEKIMSANGHFE